MWFWTDHVCSDTVTKKTRKCCWATIACPLQIVLNYTKSLHLHNIKDLLDWSCHSVTAGLPQGRTPELPKEINFQLTKGSHPPHPPPQRQQQNKNNDNIQTVSTYLQVQLEPFPCRIWSCVRGDRRSGSHSSLAGTPPGKDSSSPVAHFPLWPPASAWSGSHQTGWLCGWGWSDHQL